MGRRKLPIKYIVNDKSRRETFKKRLKGLRGKAEQLATLCGARVGVIVMCDNKVFDSGFGDDLRNIIRNYALRLYSASQTKALERLMNPEAMEFYNGAGNLFGNVLMDVGPNAIIPKYNVEQDDGTDSSSTTLLEACKSPGTAESLTHPANQNQEFDFQKVMMESGQMVMDNQVLKPIASFDPNNIICNGDGFWDAPQEPINGQAQLTMGNFSDLTWLVDNN